MNFGFYSRLGKFAKRVYVKIGDTRTVNSQTVVVYDEVAGSVANSTRVSQSGTGVAITDGGVGYATGAVNVNQAGNPVNILSVNIGNPASCAYRNVRVASTTTFSGAGAIPVTHENVYWTTTGANAGTIASGLFAGQRLTVVLAVDGGDGTVTPASRLGTATAVLNDAGDSVTWQWSGTAWSVISNVGATLS
jgi:NAD kinase